MINSLSIIYPAYNEEENVKLIPQELLPYLEELKLPYEVIVVDDGCVDKTVEEVKKLQKVHPEIKLICHERNKGLGAALKTGISNAKNALTVTIDGDFTFHPRQIKELIARFNLGDVDCVIGSPALKGYDKDVPFYRIFLSKSVNVIYSVLLGKKITAVSPIFRIYKTEQLKELDLKTTGFDINAEILFRLLNQKRKVVEIPAVLTTRKFGVSKLNNMKEIKNHLKLFLKIMKWRVQSVLK